MGKEKPIATIENDGQTVIATVDRDLLIEKNDIKSLRKLLISSVQSSDVNLLIVDFGGTSAICTALLGVLLKVRKQLYDAGVRTKLCLIDSDKIVDAATDTYAHEIFKVFELDSMFDINAMSARELADRLSRAKNASGTHCSSSSHTAIAC